MNSNIKKALLFIGMTFAINYLLVYGYLAMGGKWGMPGALVVAMGYMFVPMLVVIALHRGVYREAWIRPLDVALRPNRWFLVAWLLLPLIAFATLGVSLLFPGVEYSPDMAGMFERFGSVLTPEQLEGMERQVAGFPVHLIWIAFLQGLIAGITVNAVPGFGEKLGWRGFLQRELGYLGFWKSSAVIGVIWGVWHAPLILQGHNYPGHPVAGVLMMTVFTMLLSPIFSYVRLRARFVLAAAIIHGLLNATAGLVIMVVKEGSSLLVGVTGLAGFIVLALANAGLRVYRALAREPIMVG